MGDHALLGPSGASRWLACTPSARLGLQFPDTAGEAAVEGTLAHLLGENIIKSRLGQITKQKYEKELKAIKQNPLYNASMLGYCTDYAVFVLEQFASVKAHTKDAKIFLETRADLTTWIPEGFGTVDVSIIGRGVLQITDFKYGKGVHVDADNNSQLKIYALGVYEKYAQEFNIEQVHMTIYQPRLDNISTFSMAVPDLLEWAETVVRPRAALAFEGKGEFVPGPHCRFCKVVTCRARADRNLEIAKFDFAVPSTLSTEEVAEILGRIKELVTWGSDISEYALAQALAGTEYPGFKLVHGRSNRVISKSDAVLQGLLKMGYRPEEVTNVSLLSLTALEGLVGKAQFAEKFGSYVIKPYGAPTLVGLDDKRPAFGLDSARNDFAETAADDFAEPPEDDDSWLN